jgi:hypothetical protein
MDFLGDSFSLAITNNINITANLVKKVAGIFEVIKVMFDQKDKAFKGLKATVAVAPKAVNFLEMNVKSSEAEGYIDGTIA